MRFGTTYIHQLEGWPACFWNKAELTDLLARVRNRQGKLLGSMEAMGFRLRRETLLRTLSSDVMKNSEIEGERLDAEQVRSSIARQLGVERAGLKAADRHVEGVVAMMLDATRNFDKPLTQERLCGWQAALFPTGFSGMWKIHAGAWRDGGSGPMEVVSGQIGKEKVHFQAPEAGLIAREMKSFLKWFNQPASKQNAGDPVMKAALAHFWFVTVHPFDDGNGRVARAITDMALARAEGSDQRFYSMSAQICKERSAYYKILERTQKGPLDITPWMTWFLECMGRAIEAAQGTLGKVMAKAKFWEMTAAIELNDRQRGMLNRMLDGFEGKLTTSKYAQLAKCSQDTALRDVDKLVESGLMLRNAAGGRSTSYEVALKDHHVSL